jgi:hypothetical protein
MELAYVARQLASATVARTEPISHSHDLRRLAVRVGSRPPSRYGCLTPSARCGCGSDAGRLVLASESVRPQAPFQHSLATTPQGSDASVTRPRGSAGEDRCDRATTAPTAPLPPPKRSPR